MSDWDSAILAIGCFVAGWFLGERLERRFWHREWDKKMQAIAAVVRPANDIIQAIVSGINQPGSPKAKP